MTPPRLSPNLATIPLTALDEWTSAEGNAVKTGEQLKTASKTEAVAADAWQTAIRKLRGQLITAFPRDVRRQRSYLPATKPVKKAKVVTIASDPQTPTT